MPSAYGSDLLGQLQVDQSREFQIRPEVVGPLETLRSATTVAARVPRQEGRLGCLRTGAHADLLVVAGDLLRDLDLLAGQGQHMKVTMKGGVMHKRAPDAA